MFTLGAEGGGSLVGGALHTITVHIHTLTWANEINWNIDNGQSFGIEPQYDDNSDYYDPVTLSAGEHSISYYDSYGDGWHGGYWEILPGSLNAEAASGVTPIVGGPVDGLVAGSGGTTSFVLGAGNAAEVSTCSTLCVRGFQCPDGWWWDDANGECVRTQAECP